MDLSGNLYRTSGLFWWQRRTWRHNKLYLLYQAFSFRVRISWYAPRSPPSPPQIEVLVFGGGGGIERVEEVLTVPFFVLMAEEMSGAQILDIWKEIDIFLIEIASLEISVTAFNLPRDEWKVGKIKNINGSFYQS